MIDLDPSMVWEFICSVPGCELNGIVYVVSTELVECGGCNSLTQKPN